MNSDYVIISDSNCDLEDEVRKEFDIFDYVPGHATFPGKGEILTKLDWNDINPDEFYADLKKRPNEYTTSPANIDELRTKFEKYTDKGLGVIFLCISSALSGEYNFACKAAEELLKKNPSARIKIIDTLRFGPGSGLLVLNAAKMRLNGASYQEVIDYVETNKNRYHQSGWLDDLSFVAKKGRLNSAAAFFGTLVGIKPMGEFDENGLTTILAKFKGEKAAYEGILQYIEATIENPADQLILIAETNRRKQAEVFKTMIEERFHPREVRISKVHPQAGINVGPGLMAAYYVGKPISKGLVKEKEIAAKITSK